MDVVQLKALATQIKNETEIGGNTANRIGSAFEKAADLLANAASEEYANNIAMAGSYDLSEKIALKNSGYISSYGGVFVSDNNWLSSDYIAVNNGDIIMYSCNGGNRMLVIAAYDENKAYIADGGIAGDGNTPHIYEGVFNVPNGAKYIRVCSSTTKGDASATRRYKSVSALSEKVDSINDELSELLNTNEFDLTTIKNVGYTYLDGNIRTDNENYVYSDFISINSGTTIDYKISGHNNIQSIAFYDKDRNFISGVHASSQAGNKEGTIIGSIDTPSNSTYVRYTIKFGVAEQYIIVKDVPFAKVESLDEKLDKYTTIDIFNGTSSGYIETDGVTSNTDKNWLHTGYILCNEGDKFTYNLYGHKSISTATFYDNEGNVIETYVHNVNGRYWFNSIVAPAKSASVRFCGASDIFVSGAEKSQYVKKSVSNQTLINSIGSDNDEQKPFIQSLKPYVVYDVCNDIPNKTGGGRNRNYSAAVYIDHFFDGLTEEKDIHCKNGDDRLIMCAPIEIVGSNENAPQTKFNNGNNINVENKTFDIDGEIRGFNVTIEHRSTLNSITSSAKPRVLCIGDSITYAEQATMPNDNYQSNNAYHLICKELFLKDNIDNGGSGFEIQFLGHYSKEKALTYNGQDYTIKTKHEGIRGISMTQHLNGEVAEFWDDTNKKWSINAWLNQYRTMDDSGNRLTWSSAGASVVGSDGKTYKIGTKITSKSLLENIDVCKPTHVLIMLSMNKGATLEQYNEMIGTIQNEVEGVIIGIAVPDAEGTYFPSRHPNCGEKCAYWNTGAESFHTQQRNVQKLVQENFANTESEDNNIYVLPFYFVTPPAESVSVRNVNLPDGEYNVLRSGVRNDGYGWVFAIHTNAYGHYNWGYQLYSWIKYTIAKSL